MTPHEPRRRPWAALGYLLLMLAFIALCGLAGAADQAAGRLP